MNIFLPSSRWRPFFSLYSVYVSGHSFCILKFYLGFLRRVAANLWERTCPKQFSPFVLGSSLYKPSVGFRFWWKMVSASEVPRKVCIWIFSLSLTLLSRNGRQLAITITHFSLVGFCRSIGKHPSESERRSWLIHWDRDGVGTRCVQGYPLVSYKIKVVQWWYSTSLAVTCVKSHSNVATMADIYWLSLAVVYKITSLSTNLSGSICFHSAIYYQWNNILKAESS